MPEIIKILVGCDFHSLMPDRSCMYGSFPSKWERLKTSFLKRWIPPKVECQSLNGLVPAGSMGTVPLPHPHCNSSLSFFLSFFALPLEAALTALGRHLDFKARGLPCTWPGTSEARQRVGSERLARKQLPQDGLQECAFVVVL